ncbi:hypothetical protein IEQ34_000157 [Dendrobium chrysotoxum]|uniref:Uncharacterized protein n=1 Tax=Dendrobium chrysotoxum TaxID=161865 RepID=A0AAV7HRN1_DENCH|nr:hypothetical protein IEQ34_000157 [Dendrobium chrysotoxum]
MQNGSIWTVDREINGPENVQKLHEYSYAMVVGGLQLVCAFCCVATPPPSEGQPVSDTTTLTLPPPIFSRAEKNASTMASNRF